MLEGGGLWAPLDHVWWMTGPSACFSAREGGRKGAHQGAQGVIVPVTVTRLSFTEALLLPSSLGGGSRRGRGGGGLLRGLK